jgi:cysteine desulfurase
MLSLSWANSLTGVIHPVWDIMEICKEREIKLHLNLNAVMGKLYFQLQEIEADFFTFNGAIISKEPFALAFENFNANPLEQLDHLNRTLTEAAEQIDHLSTETARLRDKLECNLAEMIPGCQIPFQHAHRLPHIGVIAIPGVGGDALLYLLYTQGVYANRYGQNGVSFELSATTTEQDVDRIIETAGSIAKKLQTYSSKL